MNKNQPIEPMFHDKYHGVTETMLTDWLGILSQKNTAVVGAAEPVQGSSMIFDSVHFLFLTCERLKMSNEVKYLSLELFDRFMLLHIQDLHDHVMKNSSMATRGSEWRDIKKRVSNQVMLRLVSCIQIASKLTSHYKILSPGKARRFLVDAGHHYNVESIMQSELRILKTLNFCVSVPSPLVYLETLLEALGKAESRVEVKKLHPICLNLLDMVYLQYTEVYSRLQQVAAAGSPVSSKDRDKFAPVRADKMFLQATVITSAAYILDGSSHNAVMYTLVSLTQIPAEDIADFSSVMLQLILESNED